MAKNKKSNNVNSNELNNEVVAQEEVQNAEVVENENAVVKQEKEAKKAKVKNDDKNAKGAKNNNKKKANANAEKRGVGKKVRATVSELKKVTWPTFGQTVKHTGVVLAFVLMFIVILLGLNGFFGWLFNLIVNAI